MHYCVVVIGSSAQTGEAGIWVLPTLQGGLCKSLCPHPDIESFGISKLDPNRSRLKPGHSYYFGGLKRDPHVENYLYGFLYSVFLTLPIMNTFQSL